MYIRSNIVVTYDIEVFPNVFHCCCKNTETGEILRFEMSPRINDLSKLVEYFYYNNTDKIFCGYNNHHYDDVIMNYLIDLYYKLDQKPTRAVCTSIFNLSNTIVRSGDDISRFKRWKYMRAFPSFDLLKMLFSSKLRVGLKAMQMTMHYPNVQEYEGDFTNHLPVSEIDEMIKYNINDVESTTTLLNRLEPDVNLRLFIEDEYGFNALSMDSVKFGETILAKTYCDQTGISMQELNEMRSPADYVNLNDAILPIVSYRNKILKDVLADMKSQIVYTKERKSYEKNFVLSNVVYSIGVGGIHSIHTPEIFRPGPDEYIGHSDVTSMYPSLIIKYKWIPRHLGEIFWKVYSDIYTERVTAKRNKQEFKQLALKLTLNAVSGKMQQETSWMYDPLSIFKVRINGQLILLMLVDRLLELDCKIVQVNTDGVVYIAKEANREAVQEAISDVERLTQLGFESDDYEAFYQYAINDYFGVVKGYSQSRNPKLIEKKGLFITDTKLGKGLTPTIIPKAVINYFLTKIPVSTYIKRHTDIKDFLMGQRVDKKFKVLHGTKQVQQINRYYASIDGSYLFKVDEDGSMTNMLTKSGVTILNKYREANIESYNINYDYYVREANKIVQDFTCVQLELFK